MVLHGKNIAVHILAMLWFSGATALANGVQFSPGSNDLFTADGYVTLEWTSETGSQFEVQQSTDSLFSITRTIYAGPDQATFVSGLKDGQYYYRVRAATGDWSDPIRLTVKHQSLSLALTLAGIGGFVFLLTVFVVVQGTRQNRKTIA